MSADAPMGIEVIRTRFAYRNPSPRPLFADDGQTGRDMACDRASKIESAAGNGGSLHGGLLEAQPTRSTRIWVSRLPRPGYVAMLGVAADVVAAVTKAR